MPKPLVNPADGLRLALLTVMNLKFDQSLAVIGLVRSSFVSINAATHGRSLLAPLGNEERPRVRLGNLLACRTLA